MISTLILISILNLGNGDCLGDQSEIYIDSITRLISINGEDNSYHLMLENGEKIIFTSEFDGISGQQIIKTKSGRTFEIEILKFNQLEEYSLKSSDDDIKVTRVNQSSLLDDTFETSFSTIIIAKKDGDKNWIESKDKIGVNRYKFSNNCWTYIVE